MNKEISYNLAQGPIERYAKLLNELKVPEESISNQIVKINKGGLFTLLTLTEILREVSPEIPQGNFDYLNEINPWK